MKKLDMFLGVAVLVALFVGGYVLTSASDAKYITLRATFRMGGAVYRGYEMRGETLVFMFERTGDFFTQAIETKEFTTDEKLSTKKVIMEVTTNGETRTYEANPVEESEDREVYEASEL